MRLKLYAAIGVLMGSVFALPFCLPTHANLVQTPPHSGGGGGGSLTPPAMATNAGFTTLALNLDFSGATPSSWKGTSYNATALSSWLDTGGNDGTKPMHCLNNSGVPSNCSDMSIATDPADGKGSLLIPWKTSYAVNAGSNTSNGMNSTGNVSSTQGATYPMTAYYQITMRLDQDPSGSTTTPGAAFWTYDSGDYGTAEEFDFVEMYPGPGFSAAAHGFDFFGYADQTTFPQDDTHYHTYSFLQTWDGNTSHNPWGCWLFDQTFKPSPGNGAPINCNVYNYGGDTTGQGIRLKLITNAQGDSSVSNYTMYVRDIQVWSCSAWDSVSAPNRGGTCNNPNLTNNGQGGLTYYHP